MSEMNATAAQEFSEAFGMIGAGWWRQVAWAQQQGIPDALDLSTREWVEHYVGGWARLAIEDRREAVRELTNSEENGGMGLSQREAADVLGVGVATVNRDLVPGGTDEPSDRAESDAPTVPGGTDEPYNARSEADTLITYMSGLTSLPNSAKPGALAASLNVPNRSAFAKRLTKISRYLEAVATELRKEQR